MNTGIILLAAGGSTRLGRPKQLLPWENGTLLRHAAITAVDSSLGPVVAVLGDAEEKCRATLTCLPVRTAVNSAWREGMGGSIFTGMNAFRNDGLSRVLIMLCDQPGVTAAALRALSEHQRSTGAQIVASRYSGTLGPPALFASALFPRLLGLRGPAGAKSLFGGTDVESLPLPEAALDIDTPADLETLPRRVEN
jgi:molybdenum cofactor cytidylyltransferase